MENGIASQVNGVEREIGMVEASHPKCYVFLVWDGGFGRSDNGFGGGITSKMFVVIFLKGFQMIFLGVIF